MHRLRARLKKVESEFRSRFASKETPSPFELALDFLSADDISLLLEDVNLRINRREAELTPEHRAANSRLEEAIARIEARSRPQLERSKRTKGSNKSR
jgi:hypothetical protein